MDERFRLRAQALESRPREALRLHITSVLMAMIAEARNGNVQAAKLIRQAAKSIADDTVAGSTVNLNSIHLEYIQRANNLNEF